MKKRVLIIFTVLGMIFSLFLMYREYKVPGFFPTVFNVPSCYIFADVFLLILISFLVKKRFVAILLFAAGTATGLTVTYGFWRLFLSNKLYAPIFFGLPTPFIFGTLLIVIVVIRIFINSSSDDKNG